MLCNENANYGQHSKGIERSFGHAKSSMVAAQCGNSMNEHAASDMSMTDLTNLSFLSNLSTLSDLSTRLSFCEGILQQTGLPGCAANEGTVSGNVSTNGGGKDREAPLIK